MPSRPLAAPAASPPLARPTPAPPTTYPAPGTHFPSRDALAALVHAVRPPALEATGGFDLIEQRRGGELRIKCKLGTRKPGRRRKGERRKDSEELCAFRLIAKPRSSPPASSSSSSLDPSALSTSSSTYVVTSLIPHTVAAHEAGWTGREDNDLCTRSSVAGRDTAGRFTSTEPTPVPVHPVASLGAQQGHDDCPGAAAAGAKSSPPPLNTLRTRTGTLIPLLPLVPLPKLRPKPVRSRQSREHRGDAQWDAWRALLGLEDACDAAARREQRRKVDRMGGYGALRAWGWCEGLCEPVSDEDVDIEVLAAEETERGEACVMSVPGRDEPPVEAESLSSGLSPTQVRHSALRAGSKRSKAPADPDWVPVIARSRRSATRPPPSLEADDADDQRIGAMDEDEDGASTFSNSDDVVSSRPQHSVPFPHYQSHPIQSTGAAFAPFTHACGSSHAYAASPVLPSLSPASPRETSFGHDNDTPDTSFSSTDATPACAYTPAVDPPRQQSHSPSSAYRVVRLSLPQPPVYSHRCSAEPHLPAVDEENEAVASKNVSVEERLEQDAVWALLGLKRASSAPPQPQMSIPPNHAAHGPALPPAERGPVAAPDATTLRRPLPNLPAPPIVTASSSDFTPAFPQSGLPAPAQSPAPSGKRRRVAFASPPGGAHVLLASGGDGARQGDRERDNACASPKKLRRLVIGPALGAGPAPIPSLQVPAATPRGWTPLRPRAVHPTAPLTAAAPPAQDPPGEEENVTASVWGQRERRGSA
ncbi:hypothetical protein JCM3770_006285 [Rhodotorula araucariae]